jgi:hypothetical protein
MYTRQIILAKANVNNTDKYVVGVLMVTCLYISLCQGQAEQQDKPNAQSQMVPVYTLSYFCRLCLFSVVFAFMRVPQLILHVLDNSISCKNVRSLFLVFPHSVAYL